MPKDFAKNKSPRKSRGASRQNKKKSPPIFLWLIALLLVGSFASGLIYLKWFKVDKNSAGKVNSAVVSKPTQSKQNKNSDSAPSKTVLKEEDIPLYNLHEDLINKEVKIPEEDLKLPENSSKYYYTMFCGSFRDLYRAEELKADIALTGNHSTIKTVQVRGETWHQVKLGPFNRKRAGEQVRHRLQDNDIQGCEIRTYIKRKQIG